MLCPVDVSAAAAWVSAISLADWPLQDRVNPNSRHPSMVAGYREDWPSVEQSLAKMAQPLIDEVMEHLPEGRIGHRMLSLLVPGQRIVPHDDLQTADWRARVHIPLVTNPGVEFVYQDAPDAAVRMPAGFAYLFNPEVEHRVRNGGETPRVHFFFDVFESPHVAAAALHIPAEAA